MGERKDVNDFLKKDFWSYMYDGGIHPGQLTGASLDLVPSGHSNTNTTGDNEQGRRHTRIRRTA